MAVPFPVEAQVPLVVNGMEDMQQRILWSSSMLREFGHVRGSLLPQQLQQSCSFWLRFSGLLRHRHCPVLWHCFLISHTDLHQSFCPLPCSFFFFFHILSLPVYQEETAVTRTLLFLRLHCRVLQKTDCSLLCLVLLNLSCVLETF